MSWEIPALVCRASSDLSGDRGRDLFVLVPQFAGVAAAHEDPDKLVTLSVILGGRLA